MAGLGEPTRNARWSRKIDRLVAVDDVEVEQLGVEEARRPGARHDRPGVDRLDVAHRPGELALDLGIDEWPHLAVGHVVDHRVPDRSAVLQPVQVDRAVGAQRVEVGRAAVVLVDDADVAVADTTSAESPPGPSVMLVSTWIATVSPSRSSSSPSMVRMRFPETRARAAVRSSSRVGYPGISTPMSRGRCSRSHGSSKWSPWRWET